MSPALGRGGSLGDFFPVAPLGVLVADFAAAALGESVALVDWPSFDVALEAGFLPLLVGVVGVCVLAGVLPAAGDGAILLEVCAV